MAKMVLNMMMALNVLMVMMALAVPSIAVPVRDSGENGSVLGLLRLKI